jgi:hypothetical protein
MADRRRLQFDRARDWAEVSGLITAQEINGVIYLWLKRLNPDEEGED